jgi:hypothetical protein
MPHAHVVEDPRSARRLVQIVERERSGRPSASLGAQVQAGYQQHNSADDRGEIPDACRPVLGSLSHRWSFGQSDRHCQALRAWLWINATRRESRGFRHQRVGA